MNRYVITGATGHIGNTLVRTLIAQGVRPVAIVRNADDPAVAGLDAEFVVGSFMDGELLRRTLLPGDTVVHSAGMIAITEKDADKVMNVNYGGTVRLTDICAQVGVRKLVYISSVDALYKPDKVCEISEPESFFPELLSSSYAKSKAMATQYVLSKAREGALDAVVTYPTAVIGPNDYKVSNVGQVILDFITGMPLARVDGCYNFVDVRDVAQTVITASQSAPSGSGYILGGEVISVNQLFAILREFHNRRMPPKLSLNFVNMFSALGVAYYRVRGKKPVFSGYALKTLNSNCNYSIKKAERELGYKPRPAQRSIGDSVEWFRENKTR